MKCLLLISTAIAGAGSILKDPVQGYKEGDRYFYFLRDGDESLQLVDAEEPADLEFIDVFARNPANNGYWLFTRYNPYSADMIHFGDINSVAYSHFDVSKVTVLLAHGWNGYGGNSMNQLLTEAFLQNDDVNVIVFDWSTLANRSYTTAKGGTAAVGRGLGQFINWLAELGMSYEKVHLVGFSLGGHLVGNAGRETGSRVKRITALDPAAPLWRRDQNRIVATDGQYVEVIHTNTGLLGYTDPCGDADFYPNGGSSMPGCWLNSCSHSRSYEYMASSLIFNHLLSNKCETLREANRNICTGEVSLMGNSDLFKSSAGIFRANTGSRYPY